MSRMLRSSIMRTHVPVSGIREVTLRKTVVIERVVASKIRYIIDVIQHKCLLITLDRLSSGVLALRSDRISIKAGNGKASEDAKHTTQGLDRRNWIARLRAALAA